MWVKVKGWEDLYEVNENGDVRSLRTGKLIKGDTNNIGYHRVCFYDGDRKKRLFLHRLVAQTFLPNPNSYEEVNHINEDKNDNSVSNLEWCDRKHNERENHRSYGKPYTPFIVEFVDGTVKRYEFTVDLAKELGISPGCVRYYLKKNQTGLSKKGIKKLSYL